MAQRRVVGVIMNGVTGRMGSNQHLIRSILAIRAQGGLHVPGGDADLARADPRRAQRAQARRARRRARGGALDDRPRRRAGRPVLRDLLRRAADVRAAAGGREGDRGGQARVLREAGHARRRVSARTRAPGPRRGREGRRRAGQAVPARAAETAPAGGVRVLRAHHRRARRVRLLGLSRAGSEAAAAVVELSLRGRGRDHQRHVPALALRARQRLRPRALGLRDRGHAHPAAHRRGRQRRTRRPRRTPRTRCSSSTAA